MYDGRMVTEAVEQTPFASCEAPVLSDEEFCRRAMRSGIERLGLSLDELLRRAPAERLAA